VEDGMISVKAKEESFFTRGADCGYALKSLAK
jgi:hypothetical protein